MLEDLGGVHPNPSSRMIKQGQGHEDVAVINPLAFDHRDRGHPALDPSRSIPWIANTAARSANVISV